MTFITRKIMVVQQKKLELPYIKIRTDRLMIRVNQWYQVNQVKHQLKRDLNKQLKELIVVLLQQQLPLLVINQMRQHLYQLKKEEKTSLRMDQTTKLVLKVE